MKLKSENISLIPCDPGVIRIALTDKKKASSIISVSIPQTWPSDDLKEFLPDYEKMVKLEKSFLDWGVWLIIHNEMNAIIGDSGYKGKPVDKTVEIGYNILPDHRKKGYATEAVRALIKHAFSFDYIENVKAECCITNTASKRVLEKCGMRIYGQKNDMLYWYITKPV
jgi:ribosomal-protein-alanine N-acetyltransferase